MRGSYQAGATEDTEVQAAGLSQLHDGLKRDAITVNITVKDISYLYIPHSFIYMYIDIVSTSLFDNFYVISCCFIFYKQGFHSMKHLPSNNNIS